MSHSTQDLIYKNDKSYLMSISKERVLNKTTFEKIRKENISDFEIELAYSKMNQININLENEDIPNPSDSLATEKELKLTQSDFTDTVQNRIMDRLFF